MPRYKIVTISKALEKNKSVTVGLSYQFLRRQLNNEDEFIKKTEPSYLDPFFMPKISAKKYKDHINYVKKKKMERLAKVKEVINRSHYYNQ